MFIAPLEHFVPYKVQTQEHVVRTDLPLKLVLNEIKSHNIMGPIMVLDDISGVGVHE